MPDASQEQLQSALADRYTIERELGHGGMATVYLARDLRHERLVALKVLRSDLGAALGPERFAREIKLAAGLQHPHILAVHDSGATPDGRLWFTMPYVEGESLRERLRRQRQLPLNDALRIAREVAGALDYAHRHGVIHRDIKPENILLHDGQAMVADFGVARALTADPTRAGNTLTETGMAIGTPAYMSPEQAAAERSLDGTTDVWSLGAVLYEMLAGEPPFTGPTAQAIAAKMMAGEPPSVRGTRPTVLAAVDAALRKALAPVPADRFATAAEFAKVLDTAERTAPAPVLTPAPGRRFPVVPTVAVAIVLVATSVYAWRAGNRTAAGAPSLTGPVRLAVLPFDNLGDPADAYFADGVTDEIRGKLAALPGLQVIARGSSAQYRHTSKTQQQIAQELGVRYLLVGQVRYQKGNGAKLSRVRVDPELVQVVDARSPTTRWQQDFDADLSDVFRVQADIAGQVAQQLSVALSPGAHQTLAHRPTSNLDAYDAYLRGITIGNEGNAALTRAADMFREAVRRDSTFALAWAALSDAYSLRYSRGLPTPEAAEGARAAAHRAVSLAPDLPQAREAVGLYYGDVLSDNARALAEFETGLRAAPNDADLLTAAGLAKLALGHSEGLTNLEQAARVDPRNGATYQSLGVWYLAYRRYPAARAALVRAVALQPVNLTFIEWRAMVELAEGNLITARAVIRAALPTVDSAALVAYVATYWGLGWVLDSAQQRLLVTLSPTAFEDRGSWAEALADAYYREGDFVRTRAYADSGRIAVEAQLKAVPNSPLLHSNLGTALAYLGKHDEAIREGKKAVALDPIAGDALGGAFEIENLMDIYLILGERARALDELESLLSVPSHYSPGWIRIDPYFASLHGNPRFERLIAQPTTGERPTP